MIKSGKNEHNLILYMVVVIAIVLTCSAQITYSFYSYSDSNPSKVLISSYVEQLKGTWQLNDNLNINLGDYATYTMDFTSNNVSYNTMIIDYTGETPTVTYDNVDEFGISIFVNLEPVYSGSWADSNYKTINITSSYRHTNNADALVAWLNANGVIC